MQALMLAAGMGKRLGKYTKGNTKCMVEVAGEKLITRTCNILKNCGINKLIMVVGYQKENLKEYIKNNIKDIEIEFIDNNNYDKSNNIYSLYMAKEYLKQDDTILLESDLIYEEEIVRKIINSTDNNVVAVAKYEQWMDGTVVTIDNENNIIDFVEKKDFIYENICNYYKTVNIYKFSKEFSKKQYIPFLEAYIEAYGQNEYYELALKAIAHLSRSELKALDVSKYNWYEIDDAQDLDIANCIFSTGIDKLKSFQKRYGGYWRFENIKDYCYLVNPYYPNEKLLEKMNYFSKELLTQYPSGISTQNLNASRMFNVDEENIIVGNGAAELINVLGHILHGKVMISIPAFNEYIRCFEKNCTFNLINTVEDNYQFNINKIKNNIEISDIITIINPDNPSGSFIRYKDIIDIIEKCKELNKLIIIDESFIDFADKNEKYTLLDNDLLNKYDNLIVIKSISKSYGIPGIRLGVLSTTNKDIMEKIKQNISIWNINSYGEYFLQIANLYKNDYEIACEKIAQERNRFIKELNNIDYIKTYNSQANYVLCELKNMNSTNLAVRLLEDYNIFIKDLKGKNGFEEKDYIRLAIRDEEDNNELIKALYEISKNVK